MKQKANLQEQLDKETAERRTHARYWLNERDVFHSISPVFQKNCTFFENNCPKNRTINKS